MGHSKSKGLYFFLWKRKLGTEFCIHHRIILVVKRIEFVSNRVSYIALRGRWHNIIVQNVHAPSEEKKSKRQFL